jgi:hypothetical protein
MLVHASARDYLMSPDAGLVNTGSASDQAKLVPIHEEILTICLRYLTEEGREFVRVDADRSASEQRLRNALTDRPFLEYAAIHWIQHLSEISKLPGRLEVSQKYLDQLLGSDMAVLRWLQIFHFLFQFNYPGSSQSRAMIGGAVYHAPKPHTWQIFLHNHYRSFIEHLGWAEGRRFTRWDRFMHVR